MKHWIPDKELQNARGSEFRLDGSVSGRETSCEAPSRMPQSRSLNLRLAVCSFVSCSSQGMMIFVLLLGFFVANIFCDGSRGRLCVRLMIVKRVTEGRTT